MPQQQIGVYVDGHCRLKPPYDKISDIHISVGESGEPLRGSLPYLTTPAVLYGVPVEYARFRITRDGEASLIGCLMDPSHRILFFDGVQFFGREPLQFELNLNKTDRQMLAEMLTAMNLDTSACGDDLREPLEEVVTNFVKKV